MWTDDVLAALKVAQEHHIELGATGCIATHDHKQYEDLLAAVKPDDVEIYAPDKEHSFWMMWFLRKGKRVLVLWPDEATKDALMARYAKPEAVTT